MLKFFFYLIVQTGLFLLLSFFLLFRNGGEGAQWVIQRMPTVEATLTRCVQEYTPSLFEVWTTLAPPFGSGSGKNTVHDRAETVDSSSGVGTDHAVPSAQVNGETPADPEHGAGEAEEPAGQRIEPAAIESLALAMQASGITPRECAVSLSMPMDPAMWKGMAEGERRSAAEALLQRYYRDIAGQGAGEAPVIRMDGQRLFGLLRSDDGKESRLDLMLQFEAEQGHLTAVLREPLANVQGNERLKRLYNLADGRQRCEFSLTLQGARPGLLGAEQQEQVLNHCLDRLQAQRLRSTAKEAVVVSAYWPQLPGGIRMGQDRLNLQGMARYYGVDRSTHFAFGYPMLIQEM
ncbi:hypothetical protein GTO89_08875 [Heliobacterium gestii]|uniref:Uncharacterized protein n=1 Tax=Heliomicrobium gestii TaxID=2699 RepID=A0A845LAA6_HELGE|nr:YwmB family TATA-box binding protein [Heliomicrobium gestii]MBM7866572.1 hypothetical protein [Heliomicrobium gestii]MZP43148.1 hypothetical protein [Heliomicrobium gestii]